MKNIFKLLCFMIMLVLSCVLVAGCGGGGGSSSGGTKGPKAEKSFSNKGMKDPEKIKLKLGDTKNVVGLNVNSLNTFRGAKPNAKKPFTLMVYMNGTDLEAENGAATGDLKEMVASGFNSKNLNIVVLTGGTKKWQNKVIDASGTHVYTLEGDTLTPRATFGNALISDPRTLACFTNYAMTIYPADNYGFVFWNHGGGPVWGYGKDQKVRKGNPDGLNLQQIKSAFANTGLAKKKAEFIGFDACLMATVETASSLQSFGKYLISSEEAEPGFGWDWRWLKTLSEKPTAPATEFGKEIVDRFVFYCEEDGNPYGDDFEGTLSIMDMSKANKLVAAVNSISGKTAQLFRQSSKQLQDYARARNKTKIYGDMGEDGCFDLIDLGDYAKKLNKLYPNEAAAISAAVNDLVVYTKKSSSVATANGVTTLLPYNAGKQEANITAQYYKKLKYPGLDNHTAMTSIIASCLRSKDGVPSQGNKGTSKAVKGAVTATLPAEAEASAVDVRFVLWRELDSGSDYFVRLLVDRDVEKQSDGSYKAPFTGKALAYNGEFMYLREKSRSEDGKTVLYDSPAYLNGVKVRVQIKKDAKNPEGKIVGALRVDGPEDSKLASKDVIKLKKGDKLQFRYWANLWVTPANKAKYAGQPTHKWIKGKEITVGDSLKLENKAFGKELYLLTFWVTALNEKGEQYDYYTQKVEAKRK